MPKGVYPHTHVTPKTYPAEMVADARRLYEDEGLTQGEVAERLGTSQKVIWKLMHNHGIKARPSIKRDQRREKNSSWRGADAKYEALHIRVDVARGKPQQCGMCDTTAPGRYEWANMTGRYDDVYDYVRLCIPCHRRLDAHRRKVTGEPTSPKGGGSTCPRI